MAKEASSSTHIPMPRISFIPLLRSMRLSTDYSITEPHNSPHTNIPLLYSTRSSKQPPILSVIKQSSFDRNSSKTAATKTGLLLKTFPGKSEKISKFLQCTTKAIMNKSMKSTMESGSKVPAALTRSDTFTCNTNPFDKVDIVTQPPSNIKAICHRTVLLDKPKEGSILYKSPKANCGPKGRGGAQVPIKKGTQVLQSIASESGNHFSGTPYCVMTSNVKIPESNCVNSSSSDKIMNQETTSSSGGVGLTEKTFKHNKQVSLDNLILQDVAIAPGFAEAAIVGVKPYNCILEIMNKSQNRTVAPLAPDRGKLKLLLNSTSNEELMSNKSSKSTTDVPCLAKDYLQKQLSKRNIKNNTELFSICPVRPQSHGTFTGGEQIAPMILQLRTPPCLLKSAQSDLALSICTSKEYLCSPYKNGNINLTTAATDPQNILTHGLTTSLQDFNSSIDSSNTQFSFGLDFTESTLDCSIELVDVSLSSTALSQAGFNDKDSNCGSAQYDSSSNLQQQPEPQYGEQQQLQQLLKKQSSFEMDDSLGILTPDQMREFLVSSASNTNNFDNPSDKANNKLLLQQMRINQTPSPEELPLDPVEVKSNIDMMLMQQRQNPISYANTSHHDIIKVSMMCAECVSSHTDTDIYKTEPISRSGASKISPSFITSVTSVTSLDTGYQGDGEMSRPASRGASDHSPSNLLVRKGVSRQPSFNLQQQCCMPPVRRQDPMTDSDFFTESDAEDVFNRGDRCTHIIDGHLYGPMLHSTASTVFISKDTQMEDSCMESSGVFTDVENRADDDLAQVRRQIIHQEEMNFDTSPNAEADDGSDSTGTVKSNRENVKYSAQPLQNKQGHLCGKQESPTIQNTMSSDNSATLSNRTSYCSVDNYGVIGEFQSFSSLKEAFNRENNDYINANVKTQTQTQAKLRKSFTTSTTTPWYEQSLIHVQQPPPVHKLPSSRKYASLSSLSVAKTSHTNTAPPVCVQVNFVKQSEVGFVQLAPTARTTKCSLRESVKSYKNFSVIGKCSPRTKHTQRNDKPCSPQYSASGNSKVVKTESPTATNAVRKYHVPNKWDAVMNQIAKNKTFVKTNYNNVKSKVTARLNMGAELNSVSVHTLRNGCRSPINKVQSIADKTLNANLSKLSNKLGNKAYNSSGSLSSMTTNCNSTKDQATSNRVNQISISNKRGRLSSKTNSKGSQSDSNSINLGPSKSVAKTSLRAAKKRDVRNLSISSTDLGPPSKTQQTLNGGTARPKAPYMTLTQKRHAANIQNVSNSLSAASTTASTPSGHESGKGTLTEKKSSPSVRRGNVKVKNASGKLPLKDHNRILNYSVSPSTAIVKSACKRETESHLHGVVVTEEADDKHNKNNNNNNNNTLINGLLPITSPILTLTLKSSTKKKGCSNLTTKGNNEELLRKQDNVSSCTTQRLQEEGRRAQMMDNGGIGPSSMLPLAGAGDSERLVLFNCHSYSGPFNSHLPQQYLRQRITEPPSRGVEALAVLLNYLVYDLDAFACPAAKANNLKTKEQLKNTMTLLEETKSAFTELQQQLCDKEAYFDQRETELYALHRSELENAHAKFAELLSSTTVQISELESKLRAKDNENQYKLDSYNNEMEHKIAEKVEQIKAGEERERLLHQRLTVLAESEQKLREQNAFAETSCIGRLEKAAQREHELSERIKSLSAEIKKLRASKDDNERDLRDKLNLSQDEISVLRATRRSLNENQRNANNSPSSPSNIEICRLQSEAESLRCVLELKQKEISKLSKQNEELLRDAEEKSSLQNKISLLESKRELLQTELKIKSDKEKDLARQIDEIQKDLNHERIIRTRLCYDNEALQWQLKQRSEQLHIIEVKLAELSTNNDSISFTNTSQIRSTPSISNAINSCLCMNDISPPSAPIVKGIIEKTDSVSWVLEMDDQTPEVAASKMVRRAGSFRSVERSPSTRRQLSFGVNSSLNCNKIIGGMDGRIPSLSQSISATSVIPEHSKVGAPDFKNRYLSRIRSKSVSVKGGDATSHSTKQLQRQLSVESNTGKVSATQSLSCKDPEKATSSQSPSLHSTALKLEADAQSDGEALFKNTSGRKLITCDMSKLNAGQPLGLNMVKQSPEIKESAGEALVSDTNSEDENCSAFSDDAASLASTVSNMSDSSASSHPNRDANLSVDEVLLIENINIPQETAKAVRSSEGGDTTFINTSSL